MSNSNLYGETSKPWYKEPWPWIIMAFPFTSMVLGAMMFTLAMNTNNSLVVDDYYKQGKGINRRIARDRMAVELGVEALIKQTKTGIELTISTSNNDKLNAQPTIYAAEFVLRWTHVTHSERDGEATLRPVGPGRYYSVIPQALLPSEGRYRLHVQPAGDAWRLVSPVVPFENIDHILIKPNLLAVPGAVS